MLKALTEAMGVAGHELEVSRIMAGYLSEFTQITYDRLGSLIAKKTGESDSPKVMLAGHMDEVGFMVKQITKEGFVKFLPLGGWWPHVLLSQRVKIRTRKGDVIGVIGSRPPHELTEEERKKVMKIHDMYIDVGATSDYDVKEELGILPGDPIVPVSPFAIMDNPRLYMAKAWDDRVGCAMVIDILKNLRNIKHPNTVFGVGTVQEEEGLRGATTSSESVGPDVGFALDVSIAKDLPKGGDDIVERLGSGPSIVVYDKSMIPNTRLRDLVVQTAEEEGIPYHFTSVEQGGTDAGRIHLYRIGVPSLTIGVPTRYIHSHTGILSRDDYDNAIRLLVEVIKRLDMKTVEELVGG